MPAPAAPTVVPTLQRHLRPEDLREALRADVRAGLTAEPKSLPPKWFYDARGSQLFEEITRLPEYYQTRAESSILRAHAAEMAVLAGADTLVELGSGTSEKTRLLLDAMGAAGTLTRFVPVDVDAWVLEQAATQLAVDYPDVAVHAVVGDFEQHLGLLPRGGRRLIAFLGGTIGNLRPRARARFLAELAAATAPGDALLLGTDLVKPAARLVPAYDDAAGVTAAFDLNVLAVVNRELGADFDLDAFRHRAVWVADEGWIEMRLESLRDQEVVVADLGLTVAFAAGEELLTETSAKFTRERITAELAAAGLDLRRWWTDPAGDFGVSLSVRR